MKTGTTSILPFEGILKKNYGSYCPCFFKKSTILMNKHIMVGAHMTWGVMLQEATAG